MARQGGFEVAALQPARIDLGEFGGVRRHKHEASPRLVQPARVFPLRPYPYSLYLTGVVSVLRRFQPEVLLCLGEPSELGVAQVVWITHLLCPRTKVVLYSFENVVRHWPGFPRCLRGWAQQGTLPKVDFVAACTHTAAEVWRQHGFSPSRIRVVYNGADPDHFYRRDARELRRQLDADDRFLVGYVGRLVEEKGVDVLLRALASLPDRFVLAVAGTGRVENALRALSRELGLESRVRWLGKVAREELPLHLSAFDALVLPSRSLPVWQEQFGMVLAEAMLCKVPVIGSSCGAIPEVIGEAGLIFPEGDAGALAERLKQIEPDAVLRGRLVMQGYQRALEEFTTEVFVRRLSQVLRDTVSQV
ncbi:MAG: glycosyltransferase family 4 protein [Armatimonadetes bacterium]|nr:glycosyltransferase family 4 protein [Armatimonadota bacterium]